MGVPAGRTADTWQPPHDILAYQNLYSGWEDITVDCHLGDTNKFDRHGSLHVDISIPNAEAARLVRYLRYSGLPLRMTLTRADGPSDEFEGQDAP
jgi:hypothetical protein